MLFKNRQKVLLLVDGNNYLFRGAYATPEMTNSDGMKTNAIKGFFNILMADIYVLKPTHVVIAFDKGRKDKHGRLNWRIRLYPEYKANRHSGGEIPEEVLAVYEQAAYLKKLLKAIGIRCSSVRGEEADDIIGTLATVFSKKGYKVLISSKDKDFAQLVNESVGIVLAESRKIIHEDGVFDKFGVYPEQVIDFLTLQGDKSDNVPGVDKCGAKTAAKLLAKHRTLKNVIKHRSEMTPALKKNFNKARPHFKLMSRIVKIKTNMALKTDAKVCRFPSEIKDMKKFKSLCAYLRLKQTEKQILQMVKRNGAS
jgi:DNA polymerase-1